MLVAAFLVAQSCGSSKGEISKDEALAIAREEISWDYEDVQIRNVAQGVPQRRIWAVSFYNGNPTSPERTTLVTIDAQTGKVLEVAGRRS